MAGALEAARRALRRPVRVGGLDMQTTLSQFEPDPTHAVVLGALMRGVWYRERRFDRRFEEPQWRLVCRRVAGWL